MTTPLKFIAGFLFFSLQSIGQTNIQVVLKNVGSHKIDKVDMFDLSQKEIVEYPFNDTLNFAFKKKILDCYYIRYHENGKLYRQQIWLNSGQIKIECHIDSSKLRIDSVYNSPIYYEYLNFIKNYSILFENKDTTTMSKLLLDNYTNNIDNLYSFVFADNYLRLNQNSKINLLKLKVLTDKQGDKFSWFILYPIVIERLNNTLTVNSISINDYSFTDRQNKNVKLPVLTKKYYILDFWFLGCAPCLRDHKDIFKSQKIIASKNAEVISISTDSDINKWKNYLTKNKYKWQNYLENNTSKLTEKLSVNAFPYYIILDNLGNIISTQNSFSDILKWLNQK